MRLRYLNGNLKLYPVGRLTLRKTSYILGGLEFQKEVLGIQRIETILHVGLY